MAITDPYASVADYFAVKGQQTNANEEVLLRDLKAISRYLDLKLAPMFFYKDATVTTRVYGPGDVIAPIASTTGLIIKAATGVAIDWGDYTALVQDTDFELMPRNALLGAAPRAYTSINLLGWSSSPPSIWTPQTYSPTDYRFQVTALHGWPAVPDGIWRATIELTAILRNESVYATNRIQELDQVLDMSLQARSLLKGLYETYNPYPVAIG